MTAGVRAGHPSVGSGVAGAPDPQSAERERARGELRTSGFFGPAQAAGARFFAYEESLVPAAFSADPLDEYWACRERAVAIDVSVQHKVEITGPDAKALLQEVTTRDLELLRPGRIALAALCDDDGRMVDVGTLFCFGNDRYWFVGDSADTVAWLDQHRGHLGARVHIRSMDADLDVLAVQGPASGNIVATIAWCDGGSLANLPWFSFCEGTLTGTRRDPLVVSRTGFSGERGYELWCHPSQAPAVWDAVITAGSRFGLLPGGWDVVHVLRLEAGLPFPGLDYTRASDPFEAGLDVAVSTGKVAVFVGKAALAERRAHPRCRLAGLCVESGAPTVPGAAVLLAGEEVGVVTSAAFSPILRASLAFALLDARALSPGARVGVVQADIPDVIAATVGPLRSYDQGRKRLKGTEVA